MYQSLIKLSKHLINLPNSDKKHFTFILKRKKIVSIGWNDGYKTHPIAAKYKHRFHARHSELSAILNFKYSPSELKDYDFVNIRLTKDGLLANSKPCQSCQFLLRDFGIHHIIYTTDRGFNLLRLKQ
jgi:deoxycytidylate deaminase